MNKKIIALAMVLGFVNISADTFYPVLGGTFFWDRTNNTATVTSQSKGMISYYTDVTTDDKLNDATYTIIATNSKFAGNNARDNNSVELYGKPSRIDIVGGNNVRIGVPAGFKTAQDLNYTNASGKPVYVFVPAV